MARITTARDRSKGKAKIPVTSTKGRQNRQSVSKAQVSSGDQRQATGSARVTKSASNRGSGPAVKLPNRTNPAELRGKAQSIDILRGQGGAERSSSARQTREAYQASQQQANNRGGALKKRTNSRPESTGGPVQQVRVTDMGNRQPTQIRGGSTPKMGGSGNRPALPGARNQSPSSAPSAPSRNAKAATPAKVGLRGNVATALAAAAGDMVVAPLAYKAGQQLGKALRPVGRAIDDNTPGMNSRDEVRRANARAASTGNTSRYAGARDMAVDQAARIKNSPGIGPKQVSSAPTATSAATSRRTSSSDSTATRSMASRTGGSTPSQAKAATPGQKWEDFNPNRGTSASNNPMLGDYLRSKMAKREGKDATTGIGPVASAEGYTSNLRIEKNKKKKG